MNASTSPATVPTPATRNRDRTRLRSTLAALLFVPAALASGVLILATERGSECLMYGEQCVHGLPAWLFEWSLGIGSLAFVVALAAPAVRARQAALVAQGLAECMALLVILSHV
ncbi:hypothetical protein [Streptomyces sp. NPDC046985]|uniref:hypothetical protein n=1 Tax=Streptomyces sp. NPDC046985 TaxID=3155377 RepID=UPI0033FC183A